MHFNFTWPTSVYNKTYWRYRILFHFLTLTLGVITIYWPVYQFQFLIGWDDQWFVINHYTENGLKWDNIYDIFTEYHYGQYAPLNQLYYTVLYSVFGYNPAGYHIVGVFVHLVNVILVYHLIKTVVPRLGQLPNYRIHQVSFFTALLFGILPINIEPVAWVSASKVTWYALYYLIALQFYCRYLSISKPLYYYLTLLFFVCSFGAKEQAVLLPFCLLLLDFIYSRDFSNKIVWLEKAPFLLLSILFGLITLQSQGLEVGSRSFYPVYQRVPLAFYTLSEYFVKCLLPVNLSYLYPFPFQAGEDIPRWLWVHVFAIPLVIYCFFKQIKTKWVLFGLLFFLIHIVLVVNFVSLARFSILADRYTYLSSIGSCFLISFAFIDHVRRFSCRTVWITMGVVYILCLAGYSAVHINVWKSTYALKEKLKTTIEKRSDFNALKSLK